MPNKCTRILDFIKAERWVLKQFDSAKKRDCAMNSFTTITIWLIEKNSACVDLHIFERRNKNNEKSKLIFALQFEHILHLLYQLN